VDFSLDQTFEESSFTSDGVEGAGMPDTTPIKAGLRIQQRRCKTETCGKCWTCLDNAKWDRVYREKFADPDYYTSRLTRNGSSLGWLR